MNSAKISRSLLLFMLILSGISHISYSQEITPEIETGEVDTTALVNFTLFPQSDPFAVDVPLEINLEFDLKKFMKTKYKEEYLDAKFSYMDVDSVIVEDTIRIRARGNFRKGHCSFPPIKLNLKKAELRNKDLNNTKSLKLVTHCKNSKTYTQYLHKEYLCYKLYNLLTEYSYRVRLFKINYIDSEGKKKVHTNYGFIIESDEHLQERINATEYEIGTLTMKYTDYDLIRLTSLFQYMIGNTDWSVQARHNIKLFKLMDYHKEYPIAIPYDFDYSGMVNAYYAIPDEKLGIETVRQRVYRGHCVPAEDFEPIFKQFIDKKEDMYRIVNNYSYLDNVTRKEVITYLDEFFEIIENPKTRENYIIRNCREL